MNWKKIEAMMIKVIMADGFLCATSITLLSPLFGFQFAVSYP